jgi:acetyltransferase-like isoleucine patch superfamily enzyme
MRWLRRRRVANDVRRWRSTNLGARSFVDPTAQIIGWRNVRIGEGSVISEGAWINVNDRDSAEPAILIGNNCFLGRRNFLNSGKRIRVGDYCLTGIDCHFLGSDHRYDTPYTPYVVTGNTLDGEIDIGPNCWFGASVTVLKDVRIGFGSIIGAGAVVTRDVPPFSVAVGNPARVLKRFDPTRSEWVLVETLSAEAEARIPAESDYLAQLVKSHPALKLPRVASGHIHGDL